MAMVIAFLKSFFSAYWKHILIALAVAASYWYVYNLGVESCDDRWSKTYNEQVRRQNLVIEELEKESIRKAGENKAELAAAKERIEQLLLPYTPSKTCTTMAPSFVKTWNAISAEANGAVR